MNFSQCKKAYKPSKTSEGCQKCAPGVVISEIEFRKPIMNEMQSKYLMPFKRSILYMTEQELLQAYQDAISCWEYNQVNGFQASADMNMYQAVTYTYTYAMVRVKK